MKRLLCAAAISLLAPPALAGDQATTYPYDGSFDDATFAVESAIVGRGLVIDLQSHVGEMLNRTGADVGSDVDLTDSDSIKAYVTAHPSAWNIDGVENAHLTMGSVAWSFKPEITIEAIDDMDDALVTPVLARMSELYSEPSDDEVKN